MTMKKSALVLNVCAVLGLLVSVASAQATQRQEVAATHLGIAGNPVIDNAPTTNNSGGSAGWDWSKNEMDFEAADIDRDGDLDVLIGIKGIFTRSWARPNIILINNGSGVFTDMTSTFSDWNTRMNNTRDVEAADVDNDAWLDAIVYNSEGEPTEIFLNLGNDINGNWQGFGLTPVTTLPGTSDSVCEGRTLDFDLDGNLDIVRANYKTGAPDDLYRQSSPLAFTSATNLLPSAFWGSSFGSTVQTQDFFDGGILDLNKDGNVDILMIGSSEVKAAYTDGLGGFLTGIDGMSQSATYAGIAVDFDRDGRADIYRTNDGTDFWRRNTGTSASGGIIETTSDTTSYANRVGGNTHVCDFNNDGLPDIFINHVDVDLPGFLSDQTLKLFINTGNPAQMFTTDNVNNYPINTTDSVTADFNGDGVEDMITAGISTAANPQDARIYYYISESFRSTFVEDVPDHLEFRVREIPLGSTSSRTLFNLFSVNQGIAVGSGSFIGLGNDVLPQFSLGYPYNVDLSNAATNFFVPVQLPPNTMATIHTRSIVVDFSTGEFSMTPIIELILN
ncbi:MAG: hypothetical protein ACI97A_003512 [Planctomycetota bacterium]|jgi:hypothetical protein